MIVQGFPGIGKSSLQKGGKFIDLDSSIFFVDGKRPDDWYKIYVNVANHLSERGYIVLMSSHETVTNELRERGIKSYIVSPIPELETEWIARLEKRYQDTGLDKDKRALETMKKIYLSATKATSENPNFVPITSMDYSLEKILISLYYKE